MIYFQMQLVLFASISMEAEIRQNISHFKTFFLKESVKCLLFVKTHLKLVL